MIGIDYVWCNLRELFGCMEFGHLLLGKTSRCRSAYVMLASLLFVVTLCTDESNVAQMGLFQQSVILSKCPMLELSTIISTFSRMAGSTKNTTGGSQSR